MTARYGSALTATVVGILDRLRGPGRLGPLAPADRIDGRTCLVTGANTGIGLAVATKLARRGGRVVMAGRTRDEAARAVVARAAGSNPVLMEHLDLADLGSVGRFCDRARDLGLRFSVVVLNAAVVAAAARRTVDGLEEMFQVNYLANVLLLERMLHDGMIPSGSLAADARAGGSSSPARIVFVSSEAHRSAQAGGSDEPGRWRPYGLTGAMAEYGRSKLLLTTYAAELARRLCPGGEPQVAVHVICPGAVRTRIAREAPWWSRPLLALTFRLFFRTPAQGAEPAVYLCCARAIEGRTGVYLHGMTERHVAPQAADPENGRRLWQATQRLLETLPGARRGHRA